MKSPDWVCKKNEIECHIKSLFEQYNENPDYFDEYLNEVLKYDINLGLSCFRDLVKYLKPKQKIKMESKYEHDEKSIQPEWKNKKSQIQRPCKLYATKR